VSWAKQPAAYNDGMSSAIGAAIVVAVLAVQSPKPVVRPALPRPEAPLPEAPPPLAALFPDEAPPTQQALGVTVYPSAQFLTSYDAGRGQRYYLYGATASAAELVAYYRTLLKQHGTAIFDTPQVYIFEIGKYDENTMAFPPSVTIKDYSLDGNGGFLNPRPGVSPERFPTVIQIVPVLPNSMR
jgi:hypothetical protein